jgi:hypothetical protein
MYLVAIAWIYVTLMMAVAEANSPDGTVVGAVFTFLLYGAGPLAIVMYILATPARRRRARQREAAETALREAPGRPKLPGADWAQPGPAAASGMQPDAGRHAAGDPITTEREEP